MRTEDDGTVRCWGGDFYAQLRVPPGLWLYITPPPGSTAVGNNVQVKPVDQTTGAPAPIAIAFATVTQGGITTVTSGTPGAGNNPPPPSGFRLGNPPLYYAVQTTATFSGSATLCFTYNDEEVQNETRLRLLHSAPESPWEDITTSLDVNTNNICGETTSLSSFIIGENLPPVVGQIILPADPFAAGTSVSAQTLFSDGTTENHAGNINWEGAGSAATVIEPTSSTGGSITASHINSLPGV